MRSILLPAVLLCIAACSPRPEPLPPPGILLLNNPDFGPTNVEAVITANPDCNSRGPGYLSTLEFVLPNNSTKIINVPPGAEVCWRRDRDPSQPVPGQWSNWDRAYVEPGTLINAICEKPAGAARQPAQRSRLKRIVTETLTLDCGMSAGNGGKVAPRIISSSP